MTTSPAERRELGPRPTHPVHDPMAGMSAARAGVFALLADRPGPTAVADLAESGGLHTNTVREHLDALAQAGLVRTSRRATGARGRPALLYEACPPELSRPVVREYAALASSLSARISQTSPDPVGEALEAGRGWARDIAGDRPEGDLDPVARAVQVFEDLGFAPAVVGDDVELRACPLLETARRHTTVVCNVHLGLARGLVGVGENGENGGDGRDADAVELRPFAVPGACVLRFAGRSPLNAPAGASG